MKKCPNRENNNAHLFKETEPYIKGKTGHIYLRKGATIGYIYVKKRCHNRIHLFKKRYHNRIHLCKEKVPQ